MLTPPDGGIGQGDQLLRVLDRQHLQQHGVDQAEDGGIGADAERQRKHRDRSKTGALGQQASAVDEVLAQIRDSWHMAVGRTAAAQVSLADRLTTSPLRHNMTLCDMSCHDRSASRSC